MKVEYPAQQAVSVWVGTFPTENDFDRSVDADVVRRLNLKVPIESICEISFEAKSVGVRQLLEGFSGWETFVDEAVNEARKLGIEKANAALICNYLKCDDAPSTWGQVLFLGSFVGRDVT